MRVYRRRLPHLDVPGAATFVTWRLQGSLPPERAFAGGPLPSGLAFSALDRLLDGTQWGAALLEAPDVAQAVQSELLRAARLGRCSLHAYVVMPNHVHVLWTPTGSLVELVRLVKGASSHEINRIPGRRGVPVWQSEYHDRLVRDRAEFRQIQRYIEWNPVKAGLVKVPEEFMWSSGFRRGLLDG